MNILSRVLLENKLKDVTGEFKNDIEDFISGYDEPNRIMNNFYSYLISALGKKDYVADNALMFAIMSSPNFYKKIKQHIPKVKENMRRTQIENSLEKLADEVVKIILGD